VCPLSLSNTFPSGCSSALRTSFTLRLILMRGSLVTPSSFAFLSFLAIAPPHSVQVASAAAASMVNAGPSNSVSLRFHGADVRSPRTSGRGLLAATRFLDGRGGGGVVSSGPRPRPLLRLPGQGVGGPEERVGRPELVPPPCHLFELGFAEGGVPGLSPAEPAEEPGHQQGRVAVRHLPP